MHLVVPPGGNFPETRRIELGPAPLTIGRSAECEIRVDVPGVDNEHAKISEVALIALGPDCAIGDVPLEQGSRRLLMPGDEIQIGSVVVALEGDDPSTMDSGVDSRLMNPRVRVVEGSNFGDELLLKEENRQYVIGRGAKCDLVIDDREVSREHVKLLRRGFNVFVQDQSSTRGSWLGRSAVYSGATVEWARPRMMRVGATVLSLELPEAVRRAAPAAQVSSPMTPPPRSGKNLGSNPGLDGPDSSPSLPLALTHTAPMPEVSTAKIGAFSLETAAAGMRAAGGAATPMPVSLSPISHLPAPVVYAAKAPTPAPVPVVAHGPHVYTSQFGGAAAANNALPAVPAGGLAAQPVVATTKSGQRKAWKKTGPVIGRASGLLLLALAGLAILGALFVVFSLLE